MIADTSVQLLHLSIEQREPDKDEEQVRAKDLQRRLAQREEGFALDHFHHVFSQPIADNREGNQVDNAQRSDLPFVQLHARAC